MKFRSIFREVGLSKGEFCKKWTITAKEYDAMWNGTHEFDLRMIALLESKYSSFLFANGQGNIISTNISKEKQTE